MNRINLNILQVLLFTATLVPCVPAGAQPREESAGTGLSPDPLEYVAPGHDFDTRHTRVDLDVDLENRTIAGRVTHTMRLMIAGRTDITLNCVGLSVDGVSVDGTEVPWDHPVPGGRATAWLGRTGVSRSDDRLVIHLPTSPSVGDDFEIEIRYHGSPAKGLYWMRPEKGVRGSRYEVWSQGEGEDNRYWIPCHDYPDDKATYEGIFRVQKGYYALSNGTLVSKKNLGPTTEYHWRLDTPQVSYLIMLAAGEYNVVEDGSGTIPLLYVMPPGVDRGTIDRGYGLTPDMLTFFEQVTGIAYPFDKYGQVAVQNFIYGGMENTTATVMNQRTLHDKSLGLTYSTQGLVAHELAHMWWGDMVTCREWSHMWLNEGFATYYQSLYRNYHDGEDAFRYEMHTRHQGVIARDKNKARPIVTDFYNREGARNNAGIYIKGSSVLHMLRFLIGDDAYHASIREYARRNQYGPVETPDLTRAVKDVTGQNLDWFFEQWVYLAGHPDFLVRHTWNAERSELTVRVEQTQPVGGLVPVFRTPVDIAVATSSGVKTHRVVVDDRRQSYTFAVAERPRWVAFDPDDWILKTLVHEESAAETIAKLKTGSFMVRVHAAGRLGTDRPPGAAPALAEVLKGGSHWGLGKAAAIALGKLGGDEARDALASGLDLPDARIRLACAEALSHFYHDSEAAGALQRAARNDAAWAVRGAAITSLVAIEAPDARAVCKKALGEAGGRGIVRRAALDGLAELEDTRALGDIAKYAGAGNHRTWRHAAIEAYARLAVKLDEDKARRSAARFLEKQLDDWFLRTRRTAIGAIKTLGEPSSKAALERVASADPLESLRKAARTAIDRIDAKSAERKKTGDLDRRVKKLEEAIEKIKEPGK